MPYPSHTIDVNFCGWTYRVQFAVLDWEEPLEAEVKSISYRTGAGETILVIPSEEWAYTEAEDVFLKSKCFTSVENEAIEYFQELRFEGEEGDGAYDEPGDSDEGQENRDFAQDDMPFSGSIERKD